MRHGYSLGGQRKKVRSRVCRNDFASYNTLCILFPAKKQEKIIK
jgi:hypothetical protein